MTITFQAIYSGGVLRPAQPLALAEGQTVQVVISSVQPSKPQLRPPTPDEEDYVRRVEAAESLEELLAAMPTASPLPDGYDLCQALNANRRATGEPLLYPEIPEGQNP
jgi:predicted DNA-binding antitoxin AbrB/MazE fold protein